MHIVKLLMFIPLMFFSSYGVSQEASKSSVVHLKNAKVISVERNIPASGVRHTLAVITVSTPQGDTIKLYATYFGEQQQFPSIEDVCTVDAEKTYRVAGFAADGINTNGKLLIYPKKMGCGDKTYIY